MPRYDQVYEALAERAIESGLVDIQALIRQAVNTGMSMEAVGDALLADLESNGPIFGKVVRGLVGAGEASVAEARSQGLVVGEFLSDPAIRKQMLADDSAREELLRVSTMEDVIDGANPEDLAAYEEAGANVRKTWVAKLRRTCHKCLPLHGITRTVAEWKLMGLHPSTIHDGWASKCDCELVPEEQSTGREDLATPLVRSKAAKEDKTTRRTTRAITSADLSRAMTAVEEARESPEGRALLRKLGQVGGG